MDTGAQGNLNAAGNLLVRSTVPNPVEEGARDLPQPILLHHVQGLQYLARGSDSVG